MLNICKFDDCGITFPSLADLILHIEDTHIGNAILSYLLVVLAYAACQRQY